MSPINGLLVGVRPLAVPVDFSPASFLDHFCTAQGAPFYGVLQAD